MVNYFFTDFTMLEPVFRMLWCLQRGGAWWTCRLPPAITPRHGAHEETALHPVCRDIATAVITLLQVPPQLLVSTTDQDLPQINLYARSEITYMIHRNIPQSTEVILQIFTNLPLLFLFFPLLFYPLLLLLLLLSQ